MKKKLSALLAAALLFTCVSCGTSTPPEGSSSPNNENGSSASAVPAAYREHLTIVINAQITKLDPQNISNVQSNQLFNMVYNTLVNYNNDTQQIEPELATSWEWNEDYTLLHVTLREDVKFQNGEPFTAADVAFTLDRATNSSVKNSYDHCEIVDDTKVDIFLKVPNVDFLSVLSHNSTAITSKASVEKNPDLGSAIGTGPWAIDLTNYTPGDFVELLRNDSYWGELPKTKQITLRYISEASARLIALENDEVQLITSVPVTELPMAQQNTDLAVETFRISALFFIGINSENAKYDENLRRAIACAINRDDIIAMTGDPGVTPATSMWGWQMKYLQEDFDLDLSYNPEKAKEYLSKSTVEPKVNLILNASDSKLKAIANTVQEQCRLVGITVEIEELDHVGVATRVEQKTNEMVTNTISLFDWCSDMTRLFGPGSNINSAHLNNERLNELMDLGASTDDDAQRTQYYKEAQKILHDECYYIPIFYNASAAVYRSTLTGAILRPSNSHDFSYVCMPQD